ncbi:hypothetical protein [Pseudonocardia acaciae]|uniref:hypothetical protein n=1 Tax=Pseudonocardia acaciae TaxID=551276 RepID=UPI000491B93E|nr:hypothetical protein [Pseudonocardia acaciae]
MAEENPGFTSLVEGYQAIRAQQRRFAEATEQPRRRPDLDHIAVLERLLAVLDRTLDSALANRDVLDTELQLNTRVPVWLALAEHAQERHPAYAYACRVAAGWEHAIADQLGGQVSVPGAEVTPRGPGTDDVVTDAVRHGPPRQRPTLAEQIILDRCAARGPGWGGGIPRPGQRGL